jgi:hypothetical protein
MPEIKGPLYLFVPQSCTRSFFMQKTGGKAMREKPVLDIHEVPSKPKWFILSIQHLFAMFGATILVPMLVGLSPAVALVSSGLGTLAYLLITKGQIPAYLGSSLHSSYRSSQLHK